MKDRFIENDGSESIQEKQLYGLIQTRKPDYKEMMDIFTRIIDTVPDIIVRTDLDGKIMLVNEYAIEITGYGREELEGQHMLKFVDPDDHERLIRNIQQMTDHRLGTDVYNYVYKNGAKVPFEVNGDILYSQDGTPVGIVCVCRDISERKKAEEERERLISELREALAKVKTLSGMLPICASCKKIRDDTGYWNQIESYIRDHSEAEFSHGICPECLHKLYPEFADRSKRK